MSTGGTTRTARRLAAIVMADVVGYSRQMAADEVGTLARLRSLRAEIIDPLMAEHGGRIVKLMGDGILAEFASAVSATEWAVAVQAEIFERRAAAAQGDDNEPGDGMQLRIGVNIGDIILEDGDIFGDGVNVAARLEPLAPVGGICISGAVHDYVHGRIAAEFTAGGERSLKNIAKPIAVWRWAPFPLEPELAAPVAAAAPAADRKPTLCVRPFDGSGQDASSLTAAVHDATVLALSNLSGITLLADSSRADFVASATIQTVTGRYRATVRLVDSASGQQFWSDRFDGALAEVFDAQDELALRISTAIRYSIYDRQVAETERVPAAERTREMIFARLGQTMAGGYRHEWPEAGPALDAILAADPSNSGAHAMKACWHLHEVFYGWRELAPHDRDAAVSHAREGVRCNERSDFARMAMSIVHLYAENDPERAVRESRRALELSPYYAIGRYSLGLARAFAGDAEAGLTDCLVAAQASSRTVIHHRMLQAAALAAFVAGRYDEAVDLARRADHLLRDVSQTLFLVAATAHAAGDAGEAASAAAQILAQFPDFSLARMRRWPFRRSDDAERFTAALRGAGLPD